MRTKEEYQKAFMVIQEIMDYYQGRPKNVESMKLIKTCVEKATPKKTRIIGVSVHSIDLVTLQTSPIYMGECECGQVTFSNENYCSKCGQARAWESEIENG